MKNNEPQNLFFTNGINFVKYIALAVTLLNFCVVLAEEKPSFSPYSNNGFKFFSLQNLMSPPYLDSKSDNRSNFPISANAAENIYLGFGSRYFNSMSISSVLNNICSINELVEGTSIWYSIFNYAPLMDNFTKTTIETRLQPTVFNVALNSHGPNNKVDFLNRDKYPMI